MIKKAKTRLITASAVTTALAAAVLFVFCFKGQYLLLRNEVSGEVLFYTELNDGEHFSVSYIHSVNRSPVSEHYEIRSSRIFLTELHYSAFGAGMPTELSENQRLCYEDGEMIIYGFEREMPYLCYNISRVEGHDLTVRAESIPLRTLDEPGQPLSFTITVYPKLLMLAGVYPSSEY